MMRRFKKTGFPKGLSPDSFGNYSFGKFQRIPGIDGHMQSRVDLGDDEIAGWFLGTKAENIEIFSELTRESISNIAYGRRSFHPEDPGYVTETKKKSDGYLAAIQALKDNFYRLSTFLNDYSAPFFSMRYQGHMNWDVTMPSLVGYFTAMLQNQNNVAFQGSPATTFLEIFAANDICHMIGFNFSKKISPWGHITCDGSVANLESLWSARELRFLPIGIKVALDNEYPEAKKNLQVNFGGQDVYFKDLDEWQLLNISSDEILKLPGSIAEIENQEESDVWERLTSRYSINALGMTRYYLDEAFLGGKGIQLPVVIVPSSKHYSWPKAASILDLGHSITNGKPADPFGPQNGLFNVYVDELARMDIEELKKALHVCRENKRPLLLTVAVIGSTEESAVDPLNEMIRIRKELRNDAKEPFDFNIHADAAWGGYLISILREDFDLQWPEVETREEAAGEGPFIKDTSRIPLSEYVIDQLTAVRECDSVTVDPHKWGYIPYPAGSLCYRNGNMVNLVTFGAPYIGSGTESQVESIGESGVEGSKPGASAAAVFLSHSVIRPSKKGYGKLMKQAVLNARIFYVYICAMAEEGDPFFVEPFNGIPDGPNGEPGLEYIKKTFIQTDKPLEEILEDKDVWTFIKTIGPDQNFADYIFNFYENGEPNHNPVLLTNLHNILFKKVYPQPEHPEKVYDYNIMVTKTVFHRQDYGPKFMDHLAERLQLDDPALVDEIPCMRSVVMDPWAIETKVGDKQLNFFREVFIPELRQAVIQSVEEVKKEKNT